MSSDILRRAAALMRERAEGGLHLWQQQANEVRPGDWLGSTADDLPEAFTFAEELAVEWRTRVVLRVDRGAYGFEVFAA